MKYFRVQFCKKKENNKYKDAKQEKIQQYMSENYCQTGHYV